MEPQKCLMMANEDAPTATPGRQMASSESLDRVRPAPRDSICFEFYGNLVQRNRERVREMAAKPMLSDSDEGNWSVEPNSVRRTDADTMEGVEDENEDDSDDGDLPVEDFLNFVATADNMSSWA